jgi:TRAP-type C4-dicarboxylate transport system substrate-binding protein
MNVTRSFRFGAAAAAALLAVAACSTSGSGGASTAAAGGAGGSVSGPKVTLKIASLSGPTSSSGLATQEFGKYLTQNSNGTIKVQYYWSAALASAAQQLSTVGSGLADISVTSFVYTPQDLPLSNWTSPLTSVVDTTGYPAADFVGSAANTEMFRTNKALQSEFDKKGAVVLASYVSDSYYLMCRKPVTSLSQAQGLKIRSAGGTWAAEDKALGMIPVTLDPQDQYEALQRGVIDCTAYPVDSAQGYSLFEVAPYMMWVTFSPSANQMIINKSKWNAMSPSQRALVDQAAGVYITASLKNTLTADAAVFGSNSKVKVVMAPEIESRLQQYEASVVAGALNNLPNGLSQTDATAVVNNYKAAVTKWTGALTTTGFKAQDPTSADQVSALFASGKSPSTYAPFFTQMQGQLFK